MEKRSEIEIYAAILRVAKDGAKKTHITYKTNLNFKTANRYLTRLRVAGCLTAPSDKARHYKITSKGNHFLHQYEKLTSFVTGGD